MTTTAILPGKPLLAERAPSLESLRLPCIASPKLDGIRCVVRGGVGYSRKLLPLPNRFIQATFALFADVLDGLDGEIIVGSPTSDVVFRTTTSAVMSGSGEPAFKFYVFDTQNEGHRPFRERISELRAKNLPDFVEIVEQIEFDSVAALAAYEEQCVVAGYEGIMVRCPDGPYKHGRSTVGQQILLKVKRFEDSEGEVVGMVQGYANQNEAQRDALGHIKRSTCKSGKVAKETMGAIIIRDPAHGWEVPVGTGFTAAQRARYWKIWNENPELLKGRMMRYAFQPVGSGEMPRFPAFTGWRSPLDMDDPQPASPSRYAVRPR